MFSFPTARSLGIVLALVASGNTSAAPKSGVYSNVCLYPKTDDLGGVAIQIVLEPPRAGVFWLCEGGCGGPEPMTSIRLSGDAISFSVADITADAAGKTVHSTVYHYRGRFTARGMTLTSDYPDFGRANLVRSPHEKVALARTSEAGRNDVSKPAPVRRCR